MSSTINEPTVTIAMVGPTGVGKTSLLAAMYNEIKPIVNKLGCTFTCEGPTKNELSNRLAELKAIATGNRLNISNVVSITGTAEKREYEFTIKIPVSNGKLVTVQIRFVDMPGGWYSGLGNYKEAQDTLKQSNVSFWCVDSTALMEDGGKYNDIINEPENIYDVYQAALHDFRGDHHIQFLLMRSETYQNGGKEKDLTDQFRKCYEPLFERLKNIKNSSISGAYRPVQTVGNVEFFTFNRNENGKPTAAFKLNKRKGYSPQGCAYPIACALTRGLGKKWEQASAEYSGELLPEWIVRLLGMNTKLDEIQAIVDVFEKLQRDVYGVNNADI